MTDQYLTREQRDLTSILSLRHVPVSIYSDVNNTALVPYSTWVYYIIVKLSKGVSPFFEVDTDS